MDVTTLVLAVFVSLGFIGVDAALTNGNVGLKMEVTQDLVKEGYTAALVDTMVSASIAKHSTYRSVIRPPAIHLANDKTLVNTLQDALNLKDMTTAFQTEFGLDPVRVYGSLMSATTEGKYCGSAPPAVAASPSPATGADKLPATGRRFRFMIVGASRHTGSFAVDCTSPPGMELSAFIDDVSLGLIEALEPYTAAIQAFNAYHQQRMYGSGDIVSLRRDFDRRIQQERQKDGGNDEIVAALENLVGIASLMNGDLKEAGERFDRAIAANKQFAVPLVNHALLSLMQNQPNRAADLIEKALTMPQIIESPILRSNAETIAGMTQLQKGAMAAAGGDFLKAINDAPGSFFPYYYWSKMQEKVGNLDDAKLLRQRAQANLISFETYPEVGMLYFLGAAGADGGLSFRLVNINHAESLEVIETVRR